MTDAPPSAKPPAAAIYALTIERFRGITSHGGNGPAKMQPFLPSNTTARSLANRSTVFVFVAPKTSELAYEIVQPDGFADSYPVALRRAIGLVRLSGDDRNDRDLRLVQGSALDRLLSDKGLRSRMASELAKNDVKNELTTEAQTALENIDTALQRESLPADLDLAITGGQGPSIASMIGLTQIAPASNCPLRAGEPEPSRLSAPAIAEQNQGDAHVQDHGRRANCASPCAARMVVEV
ncbi:hypothetical protein ABIB73_007257 [Bradyrhizobium sp. F1.4.3]